MVEETGGEPGFGFSFVLLREGALWQGVIVMRLADLGKEDFWQGKQEAGQPNGGAGDVDGEEAAAAVGVDSVDDGQVTVYGYAGQQQAAAVEIDFVQRDHNFAEHGPEDPAHRALSHCKRQDKDQEKVSYSQVEQEGLGRASSMPVPLQDHKHQDVSHHPQEEDEAVGHRHEYRLEGGQ